MRQNLRVVKLECGLHNPTRSIFLSDELRLTTHRSMAAREAKISKFSALRHRT
jgi:hypothetical protein